MRIGIDARPLIFGRLGGISVYVENILKHWPPSQHEVYLYAHRKISLSADLKKFILRDKESFLPGTLWLVTKLPQKLFRDRIDVFWGTQGILPVSIPGNIRLVLTVNDLVFKRYPRTLEWKNLWLMRLLTPASLHRANKIIAISQNTAKDIKYFYPAIEEEKIRVIYPGIENDFYPREKLLSREYVAKKFSVKGSYILSVGTLEPRKNFSVILETFTALAGFYPGILVIVGRWGWKTTELRKLIKNNMLARAGRILFLDSVKRTELPFLYSAADLLLFPSLYEGFGLPPLEAMACGCPVIVSNTSSLPEVVGNAGILLPPMDINQWIEKSRQVIADKTKRKLIQEKGIQWAKNFSWKISTQKIIDIIEERE